MSEIKVLSDLVSGKSSPSYLQMALFLLFPHTEESRGRNTLSGVSYKCSHSIVRAQPHDLITS